MSDPQILAPNRLYSPKGPIQVRLRTLGLIGLCMFLGLAPQSADAQGNPRSKRAEGRANEPQKIDQRLGQLPLELPEGFQAEQLVSPAGLSSTMNMLILLTILSLAPSILMMTTCFIRFVIVFGILRQALGTQQLPPNQVLISLSLFLTFLIMTPVWQASYEEGIRPYTQPAPGEPAVDLPTAAQNTLKPIRNFLSEQIEQTDNTDVVWTLLEYQRPEPGSEAELTYREPETWDDVPIQVLLPAYLLSELKTAFIIGFQIYIPFLIIDMVIASVLVSMGMMMLSPTQIALPFKLLLFVLVDGWGLTVGMLLESVRVSAG